jgi:hypothetical protein
MDVLSLRANFGNVFAEPLPSNVHTRHDIYIYPLCVVIRDYVYLEITLYQYIHTFRAQNIENLMPICHSGLSIFRG